MLSLSAVIRTLTYNHMTRCYSQRRCDVVHIIRVCTQLYLSINKTVIRYQIIEVKYYCPCQ